MPDALFANSTAGSQVATNPITATAASPKLGMTYDLTDQLRAFVQYAHGLRAPPYDNAIFGFVNQILGYEILPNGDLVPRTLNGHEVGLRGRDSSGSSFEVSRFCNTNRNFIDVALVTSAIGGLCYRGASGWGGELRTTDIAKKKRVSAAATVGPTDTTMDALLAYKIALAMTLNAGVFNIRRGGSAY
jgi:outer membrane receptor protein involved in Fe transport